MAAPIRPLVAGNWKMNGLKAALSEATVIAGGAAASASRVDVMLCPPATLLALIADRLSGSHVQVGGQDCHATAAGAHTGDVSAEMLVDAGAKAVILGHSERRSDHGETSADVLEKVKAAHRSRLVAIVCIGETSGERLAGLTLRAVARQLKGSLPDQVSAANTVIAYEPVWAIGTGLTPTVADVAEVHAAIRAALEERYGPDGHNMRILYGGSVKASNARELMGIANVNGALVGGASLKAGDFLGIIAAYSM